MSLVYLELFSVKNYLFATPNIRKELHPQFVHVTSLTKNATKVFHQKFHEKTQLKFT